jgi:hypothetical protein
MPKKKFSTGDLAHYFVHGNPEVAAKLLKLPEEVSDLITSEIELLRHDVEERG